MRGRRPLGGVSALALLALASTSRTSTEPGEVLDVDELTDEEAAILAACSRKATTHAQYDHTRRFSSGSNVAAVCAALEGRELLERHQVAGGETGRPGLRAYYVPTARGAAALEAFRRSKVSS